MRDTDRLLTEFTELSNRVQGTFAEESIKTVGDLLSYSEEELYRIPNLGHKSLDEIKAFLGELGYTLKGKTANQLIETEERKKFWRKGGFYADKPLRQRPDFSDKLRWLIKQLGLTQMSDFTKYTEKNYLVIVGRIVTNEIKKKLEPWDLQLKPGNRYLEMSPEIKRLVEADFERKFNKVVD